jgi:hypothetical protein
MHSFSPSRQAQTASTAATLARGHGPWGPITMNTGIGDERYHRYMSSDMPPGAFPPDRGQHWGPPSAPTTTSGQPPVGAPTAFGGRPPRWPALTALAIALIALAVGLAGWFRPVPHNNEPPPEPTYTDQQVTTAKAALCTAFGNVDHALDLADTRSTGSIDPTAQLGVATSTRQVLDAGSRYLLAKLAEQPATPSELATAIRQQANAYQDVVIGYLDGLNYSDPILKSAGNASNEATNTIRRLCK